MTQEEINQEKEKYEAKLANNKAMRAELDLDKSVIKLYPSYEIKTLGDIIYYCIIERLATYFANDANLILEGNEQCYKGKRRTIEDIYKIQRSYKMKMPFKTVKAALESLVEKGILEQVFCKRTLVRTHGRATYTHNIGHVNSHLNSLELNGTIQLAKVKAIKKKK